MKTILLKTALDCLIKDSKNGIRVQKNGNNLSKASIVNYTAVLRNLIKFESKKQKTYELTANTEKLTRSNRAQQNYWSRFYRDFRAFLFANCNAHDNYVALHMKVLKLTFKYMRIAKFFPVGNYEHIFYSPRLNNSINIFPIELLGTLIKTRAELQLTKTQHRTLAVFLFGISIGLRYSDLKLLKRANIIKHRDGNYLQTISRKTKTHTRVKLPQYAMEIIESIGNTRGFLFPLPQLPNFNTQLKDIARKLQWTWPVQTVTSKYGKVKLITNQMFCDIISSHMMRRTSITALLSQGVNESVVRQISGHTAGSKEFYRYVQYSQQYLDTQTDRAWEKILM